MKILVKFVAVIVALVIVIFAGLSIFVGTLDADKYRPRIVQEISNRTGRTVKLNGPIAFSLGLGGVKISAQDASIGNPGWASRPTMAGMGKFELMVGIWPLLSHRLSVNELTIENADILLESNAQGQHNWDFGNAVTVAKDRQTVPVAASSAGPTGSLSIDNLTITNSQLALRGADGKTGSYNVAALHLGMGGSGAEITFRGDVNSSPVSLTLKTSITDLLSKAPFTFEGEASYGAIRLTAKGDADLASAKASISAYQLFSGKSAVGGVLSATWGGSKPTLRGNLTGAHIDMADFKASDGDAPAAGKSDGKPAAARRLFSDAPLPLDGLKAVDADMDVAVDEFVLGQDALKKITAKLALSGGNLIIAPVKAFVGDAPVDLQIRLNAAQSPAHLLFGMIAEGLDLGDLQKMGGMKPFMTGKAGANIQLSGDGNSAHAIASSLGGVFVVTAQNGSISSGAAADISSSLAALFNPKGGNAALNCLAARFNAKNGVLNDNGVLIDTSASTVAGKGDVNLGSETVNLSLRAKTKLVDVGGLVPALLVSGGLSDPRYTVDAAGMVKNVVGSLLNGNANILASGVPDMQTAPAGQNACIYTLDHPVVAPASTILPGSLGGKASQQIQNLGNSLKGLFGR